MGLMVPFDLGNWMSGVLTKSDCSVFVTNRGLSINFNIPIQIQLGITEYGFTGHYIFVTNSEVVSYISSLKVGMKRMGQK